MTWLYLLLALVVVAAALRIRHRLRRGRGSDSLTDDMVRRIEREGRVRWEEGEAREALDLEAIRKEEDRFWEQSWDEPEPL